MSTIIEEIERKFLLPSLPDDLVQLPPTTIHQSYLATGVEELRIRLAMKGDKSTYTMAKKVGLGRDRKELDFAIEKETYLQLVLLLDREPLKKHRRKPVIDGLAYELDFYLSDAVNSLTESPSRNLVIIEIEFPSKEEADAYVPLPWFGKEVTEDERYKNQNLWLLVQQ
jgi:adenylate cyclase